ncbi:MAG: DNA-binding domain-containing protein [Paludibacter sp.]
MSVIQRTIKAFLYPNPMKNANGKYLARTSKYSTYNIREICDSLHARSGIVNVDAMEYHVKLFLEEMTNLLEDGNKINTGYFSAQANVRGAFNSKGDQYDSKRHSVQIVFSTGHAVRQRAAKLKAKILGVGSKNYGIWSVTDAQTKSDTDKLVMNHLLIITGEKIKITGDDPSTGLYLIHTESGIEHHFMATELYQNGNARLILIVPELASGTYQLKITTQYAGKGTPLAQPRSSTYANLLHAD